MTGAVQCCRVHIGLFFFFAQCLLPDVSDWVRDRGGTRTRTTKVRVSIKPQRRVVICAQLQSEYRPISCADSTSCFPSAYHKKNILLFVCVFFFFFIFSKAKGWAMFFFFFPCAWFPTPTYILPRKHLLGHMVLKIEEQLHKMSCRVFFFVGFFLYRMGFLRNVIYLVKNWYAGKTQSQCAFGGFVSRSNCTQ